MPSLTFTADFSGWQAGVAPLLTPHHSVIAMLEHALYQSFLQTQTDVHVVTGSLRGSGRTATQFNGSSWEGTVTYGGSSPGFPHDPVYYAGVEQRRGEAHDFLRGADTNTDSYLAAIAAYFDSA